MEDKALAHEVLRCSFCNKSQDQIRKLIAGPSVFICDECVEVCVDIMVDRLGTPLDSCSLCDRRASSSALLPILGRGQLCGDCTNAIEDALSRGRLLGDVDNDG